jgi:hypothetical protein
VIHGESRFMGVASMSTEELAAWLKILPQSIRKRFCETGSYYGLRPTKLPNRRLMWPADSKERLSRGQK